MTLASQIQDCFEDEAQNNTYLNLSNDYYCYSGYDFSNLNNLTINCNNHYIQSRTGDNFSLIDSQINFENCELLTESPGVFLDSINSNISFTQVNYSDMNLSSMLGTYFIDKYISFDIKDYLNDNINDFKLNFSSLSQPYNFQVINQSVVKLHMAKYKDDTYTTYNNYSILLYSQLFGTSNSTIKNLTQTDSITLKLKDINSPIIENIQTKFSNTTMEFNIIFDEKINGTIEILDNSDSQIIVNNITTYQNQASISAQNLNPNTIYKLNYIINDRFDNTLMNTYEYKTYITPNITIDTNYSHEYSGNPQNTSSFNISYHNYAIGIEYLSPLNLSNVNLTKFIKIYPNLLYVNHTSQFNTQARVYFFNLSYQTEPVILKNNVICDHSTCQIESYNLSDLIFNVSGFSNYSTTSNSRLNFTYTTPYLYKNITLKINYSKTYNKSPIENGTCSIIIDSQSHNLFYNNQTKYYQTNVSYQTIGNKSYQINCESLNYDDKQLTGQLETIYQHIDNFTTLLEFKEESQTQTKVTKDKNLNLTITSIGNNNTGNYFDTKYYFLISKDRAYPQDGWDNESNMTSWIDIGKNEFFRVYNNEEEYTSYELANSTIGNFSQYIFIDEEQTSLYINVKACTPGGHCKYYANDENNVIFEDTTPPQLINPINISQYYNSNTSINFSYHIRDLQTQTKNVTISVMLNNSYVEPNTQIPFIENQLYNYYSNNYSLNEGKYYKILLEATNNIPLSKQYYSNPFLIDTISPYNLSINTTDNAIYLNTTHLNLNLNPGQDYSKNYSANGKKASGLSHAKIIVTHNATLLNSKCINYQTTNNTIDTINISLTNYTLNLTPNYCYNISYIVYDKAGNYNITQLNHTIKLDTSKPQINLIDEKEIIDYTSQNPYNAEDIDFSYSNLNSNTTLFNVKWNITDPQSSIKHYNLQLIDNTTGTILKNITNYTSQNYVVKYNSSYIFDNHNYKLRVIGINNANLKSDPIESNGASIFILKVPVMNLNSTMQLSKNYVLDTSNNSQTTLSLYEKKGFNVTCKIYEDDISYQNDSGILCTPISQGVVNCTFNTNYNLNNFSVSCKSNESIKYDRTYNNNNDNLDLQIFVQENKLPTINSINSQTNYSNTINILDNQTLLLNITYSDPNDMSYLIGEHAWKFDNLTIRFNASEQKHKNTSIHFIQNSSISNSYLELEDDFDLGFYKYKFYFNNTINHSKIISLNNANPNSYLKIYTDNLSKTITTSKTYSTLNIENITSSYHSGISKVPYFNGVISDYNISYNKNGIITWDLENYSIRKKLVNISLNLSDEVDYILHNLTINISPSFRPPYLNQTYYNLNNNISSQTNYY
jgi:hypothetical protein